MHVHKNNTFGNFDSFSDSFSKLALREFHKDPFTLDLIDHYMMLKVQNENLLKKKCGKRPGPDPTPSVEFSTLIFFYGFPHSFLPLFEQTYAHTQSNVWTITII